MFVLCEGFYTQPCTLPPFTSQPSLNPSLLVRAVRIVDFIVRLCVFNIPQLGSMDVPAARCQRWTLSTVYKHIWPLWGHAQVEEEVVLGSFGSTGLHLILQPVRVQASGSSSGLGAPKNPNSPPQSYLFVFCPKLGMFRSSKHSINRELKLVLTAIEGTPRARARTSYPLSVSFFPSAYPSF